MLGLEGLCERLEITQDKYFREDIEYELCDYVPVVGYTNFLKRNATEETRQQHSSQDNTRFLGFSLYHVFVPYIILTGTAIAAIASLDILGYLP